MPNILQLDHVTKKFSGLTAVDNLSLQVEEHSIHSLIGPNGSGKTTTINLISGVIKVTDGSILYCGEQITNLPTFKIIQKGIGRTYQNIKLFSSMSAADNVKIGGHKETKLGILRTIFDFRASTQEEKALDEKATEILNFIGMYEARKELVKNLPYGRQKILEIGRALMANPNFILLDEPAAGLNPSERAELVSVLEKIFDKGITLFLIEHNMDVVMHISNKITVLNFGAKIAEGTPKEIQNNEQVIKAYLGEKYKAANEQTGGESHC